MVGLVSSSKKHRCVKFVCLFDLCWQVGPVRELFVSAMETFGWERGRCGFVQTVCTVMVRCTHGLKLWIIIVKFVFLVVISLSRYIANFRAKHY